jgi:hypothetical protein
MGVNTGNNLGLWRVLPGGGTDVLLRKGRTFVFGLKTLKVIAFSVLKPAPFVTGQSRSVSSGATAGVTVLVTFNDLSKAVLRLRNGTDVVAHKGDEITVSGVTVKPNALFTGAINGAGTLAWRTNLLPNGGTITAASAPRIIRTSLAGTHESVAQATFPAPGTTKNAQTALFASFSDPVINAGGTVAFRGTLKPGSAGTLAGVNTIGLWSGEPGSITLAARQGDQPPGLGSGTKFTAFNSFVLPDTAGIVTLATVAGSGITTANNQGIWAVDKDGVLQRVLQKGDKVEIGNGQRTIGVLKIFQALPFVSGQGRNYATTGDLAFYVGFTDGSHGLFRVVFP